MKGRGGSAASDEADLFDVELLDAESSATQHDVVHTSGIHGMFTVLGLMVAAGLLFFLATGSNDQPEEASPSTTIADETTTTTLSAVERRAAALTNLGVILGEGPDLDWHQVEADLDTAHFVRRADGFVGDNGTTEFRIMLDDGQASIVERPSPLLAFPNYRLQAFGGDRLLVPEQSLPDHIIVLPVGEGDPIRVELPPFGDLPEGELIETTAWVYGSILGDRFVAVVSAHTTVDTAAVAQRTGRDLTGSVYLEVASDRIRLHSRPGMLDPILYDEVDFTEAEIAQLQQTDTYVEQVFTIDLATGRAEQPDLPDFEWLNGPPVDVNGSFTMTWSNSDGVMWSSSTIDGLTWSTQQARNSGWFLSSGTQLFDFGGDPDIRRSLDDGKTWDDARMPRRNTEPVVANDVIALGRSWSSGFAGEEVVVEASSEDYELVLVGDSRFELRHRSGDAEPVLSGHLWDQASSATWDAVTNHHVFSDPRTGAELMRVAQVDMAIASAKASPTTEIALGHWPVDQDKPEWLLAPPEAVFGSGALTVDFVAGDGRLVAIVTTNNGYELHIADVTEAL